MVRRTGREATLTSVAEALLPSARALISASEAALATVALHSQGLIRLGTVESVSSFLLPRSLSAFRLHWPRVDLQITIGLCDNLRKRVRRFELDAAITIEGSEHVANGQDGWTRKLATAQLSLVVSPLNPLADGLIGREDLRCQTLLLADPNGAFNGLLRNWLGESDIGPKFESAGSIDGVKRGVQNGEAIGVLPAYAVAEELTAGSLIELKVRDPLPAIALLLTTQGAPVESSPLQNLTEQIGESLNAA